MAVRCIVNAGWRRPLLDSEHQGLTDRRPIPESIRLRRVSARWRAHGRARARSGAPEEVRDVLLPAECAEHACEIGRWRRQRDGGRGRWAPRWRRGARRPPPASRPLRTLPPNRSLSSANAENAPAATQSSTCSPSSGRSLAGNASARPNDSKAHKANSSTFIGGTAAAAPSSKLRPPLIGKRSSAQTRRKEQLRAHAGQRHMVALARERGELSPRCSRNRGVAARRSNSRPAAPCRGS